VDRLPGPIDGLPTDVIEQVAIVFSAIFCNRHFVALDIAIIAGQAIGRQVGEIEFASATSVPVPEFGPQLHATPAHEAWLERHVVVRR
jgi:hypothetical protein